MAGSSRRGAARRSVAGRRPLIARRYGTRRFATDTDSIAAARSNVAAEMFLAITRTVSFDQAENGGGRSARLQDLSLAPELEGGPAMMDQSPVKTTRLLATPDSGYARQGGEHPVQVGRLAKATAMNSRGIFLFHGSS